MRHQWHRIAAGACILPLLAVSLLMGGCSSIRVVETWNGPGQAGHRYQKLMIVGIGHDDNLRALAENVLVDELRRGGVAAVASNTMIREIDKAVRDDVVAAVRQAGADGVLAIRAVAKGDRTVTQDGRSEGIYGTATNVGGTVLAGARDYSLATLQTNLYDADTAALVWSATVRTFDAGQVDRVSRDLARFLLEQWRKDGRL
jgi:hypothetical protein